MKSISIFLATLLLITSSLLEAAPLANTVTHPGPGTPERKLILDAMRPVLERTFNTELQFVVNTINVSKDWALVVAAPQSKNGKKIDGKKIFGKEFEYMDGIRVDAILKNNSGTWTLFKHQIGSTDVWYAEYCEGPNKMPKEILGVCP